MILIPRPLSVGNRFVFTCKQTQVLHNWLCLFVKFFGGSLTWLGCPHPPFLSGPLGSFTTGLWEVEAGSPSLLWPFSLAPQPLRSIQNGHPGLHRPWQGEGSPAACPAQAQQRQQLSEQKWGLQPGLGSSHTLSLPNLAALNQKSLPPASYLIQLPFSFRIDISALFCQDTRSHSKHSVSPHFPRSRALASKTVGLIPTVPFTGHTLLICSMISWSVSSFVK